MEWIDCKGMAYKDLEEIRCRHKGEEGNIAVFLYGDGSMQSVAGFYGAGAPVKYLLTRVHPNASMIAKYISSMRPVYLDGVETENPLLALDTMSSERLSFLPPKKTAMIKYRQYLCQSVDGEIERQVVNYGACVHLSGLEKSNEFVRWIDDDWITEEVEL